MFITALILGFTGSVHCIGMCSPLAMAVTNASSKVWINRLLYNAGRIFTYACMGFAASSAEGLMPISQYQNIISCVLGVVLLVMGIVGVSSINIPFITPLLVKFIALLKKIFARYIQKRTPGNIVLLGMINGFLPCGLTFIALTFCLTFTAPWQGFVYMFLFGVGTLPAMLGIATLINPIAKRFQWRMQHVMTVLLVMSGGLLIARGVMQHSMSIHQHHAAIETEIVICR